MIIVNLTQHVATDEQVEEGVVGLSDESMSYVRRLLTFNDIPCIAEIRARAEALAEVAAECYADAAMIGGAPYLMGALEGALRQRAIKPLYAFSVRESQELTEPDGSVRKVTVFRYRGWVEV